MFKITIENPFPNTAIKYDATREGNKNVDRLRKMLTNNSSIVTDDDEANRIVRNMQRFTTPEGIQNGRISNNRLCSTHNCIFEIEYEFEGQFGDYLTPKTKYNANTIEVINEEGRQFFYEVYCNDTDEHILKKKFRTVKHDINDGSGENCLIYIRPYGIKFFNLSPANLEPNLVDDIGKPVIMNWKKTQEELRYLYGLEVNDENIIKIPKENIRLDSLVIFNRDDNSITYDYEIESASDRTIKIDEENITEVDVRGRICNQGTLEEENSIVLSTITNVLNNKLEIYCSDTASIHGPIDGQVTYGQVKHRRPHNLPCDHLWIDEETGEPLLTKTEEDYPSILFTIEPEIDADKHKDKPISTTNERNNILISNNTRIEKDDDKTSEPEMDYNFEILNRWISVEHPLNNGFKDEEFNRISPIFIKTMKREYELLDTSKNDRFDLRPIRFSVIVNDNIQGHKEDFKAELAMKKIQISEEDVREYNFFDQDVVLNPFDYNKNTEIQNGSITYPSFSMPETFCYELKIDSVEPLEEVYNPLGLDFFEIDEQRLLQNTHIQLKNHKIEGDHAQKATSLTGQKDEVLNNEITVSCNYYANTMSTELVTSNTIINYPNNYLGYRGYPTETIDESGTEMCVSYPDLPWEARLPRVSDYNFEVDVRGPYDYFVDSSNKNLSFDIDMDNNMIYGITRESIIWRPFIHTGYFYMHGDEFKKREERDPNEFYNYPISAVGEINLEEWSHRQLLDEDLLPNFVRPTVMLELEDLAKSAVPENRAETNLGGEGHYYDFGDIIPNEEGELENPYVTVEDALNNEWHYYKASSQFNNTMHLGGASRYENHIRRTASKEDTRIIFVEGNIIFDRAKDLHLERYHFVVSGEIEFRNHGDIEIKDCLIYAGEGVKLDANVENVNSSGLIISHGNIQFNNSGEINLQTSNDLNLEHLPQAFIQVIITDLDTIKERYLYNQCRIDSVVNIGTDESYITNIKPKQFAPVIVKGLSGVREEDLIVDSDNSIAIEFSESQIGNLQIIKNEDEIVRINNFKDNRIYLDTSDIEPGHEVKARYLVGEDAAIHDIKRVIFFDQFGEITLTNNEKLEVSKDNTIYLTYNEPILDSIEVKSSDEFKIDILEIEDNKVYLDRNASYPEQEVSVSYVVNNSYTMKQVYNTEINDFQLEFRFSNEYDQHLIYYENSSWSPFYELEKIDINPNASDINKSFIYITSEDKLTNKVEEFLPQSRLNSRQKEYIFKIKLLDEDNNPIYNQYKDKDISIESKEDIADIYILNNSNHEKYGKTLLGNSRADTLPDPCGNIYFKYVLKDKINLEELEKDFLRVKVDNIEDTIELNFFTPKLDERFAFINLKKEQNIMTNYEIVPVEISVYDQNFIPVKNASVEIIIDGKSFIETSRNDGKIKIYYSHKDDSLYDKEITFIEANILDFDGHKHNDTKKITIYPSEKDLVFDKTRLKPDQRDPNDGIGFPEPKESEEPAEPDEPIEPYEPEEEVNFFERSINTVRRKTASAISTVSRTANFIGRWF